MTIDSKFVLPDFVESADASAFDASESGAFAVAGYRLDNPAGIWKAASDLRSGAVVGSAAANLIKHACALFGITEEHFVLRKEATTPPLTISDGTHTASFNICDNESLNKAASDLISERDNMRYAFAHDCAHTLATIAEYGNLSFDSNNLEPIRKLAGVATVDYDKLQELVTSCASRAHLAGKDAEAAAFTKLAAQCTSACPAELVPDILDVVDKFASESGELNKTAGAYARQPETVVYLSESEYLTKRASDRLNIDGFSRVTRGDVDAAVHSGVLYKWAADNGYNIRTGATADEVIAVVQHMPRALRQEFVNVIG